MKQTITILTILTLILNYSFGQTNDESSKNQSDDLIMTIRGFDFLKSDGMTEGMYLNNPEILDTVYIYLIENENIIIQLRFNASCGHKSEEYFEHRTKMIARVCADYLIAKGIDKSRITPIGMGNTNLLDDCKCGECSEANMNNNRRLDVIKMK